MAERSRGVESTAGEWLRRTGSDSVRTTVSVPKVG